MAEGTHPCRQSAADSDTIVVYHSINMDTFRKEYCALLITVASGECRQAQRHHLGATYDREDSLSFLPTRDVRLVGGEHTGGCALFEHRDEVEQLVS